MKMNQYITSSGETLLYTGSPKLDMLESLSKGPGDIWHSSLDQGFRDAFPELVYQTAIFFWYINDFVGLDQCVSWRVNPANFVVRANAWEVLGGFDDSYESEVMKAFHFGYNALRTRGAVTLYVRNLYDAALNASIRISASDRYTFFRKNFKTEHSIYMIFREGFWKFDEWRSFLKARRRFQQDQPQPVLPPRQLLSLSDRPSVSYIIPTMYRQDYTLQLLSDLAAQTLPPTQVVVVDATPQDSRNESLYNGLNHPFQLKVIWQTSNGSCRARNEAIAECTGDYIVFGDDDIRVKKDFIENHIRLLRTYNTGACNGLDIRADNHKQDLSDLDRKLESLGFRRWVVGATQMFSNANSCVERKYVEMLRGNDINYDGGYGEDLDFGLALVKLGVTVLHNPFSVNLHLKPPAGGYRFWGAQAKILGKNRKSQPWELGVPVKSVRPVPSPTIMYMILKHFPKQLNEYRYKYFFLFLFKGSKWKLPYRLLRIPFKQLQFNKSLFYARRLLNLGTRTE